MVRKKIIWSKQASEDLYEILDYFINRNGSSEYSKKIKARIDHTASLLQIQEKLGWRTDQENIRYFIELDYLIFYEILDDFLQILMTWDSRQDPGKLNKRLDEIT